MTFEQFYKIVEDEVNRSKNRNKENYEYCSGKVLGMWRMFKLTSDYTKEEYEKFFDNEIMDLLDELL